MSISFNTSDYYRGLEECQRLLDLEIMREEGLEECKKLLEEEESTDPSLIFRIEP